LSALPLAPEERSAAVERAYKVRAPAYYLGLVDWNDPDDPIRRQVVPSADELRWHARELADPIGDEARSPVPRLVHRYPDRVLLLPTYQCAVYCRHCFRKESVSDGNDGFSREAMEPALGYVAAHAELREVILTGGDPLMLSDTQLAWLRERLESIAHLRLLRLHTRAPVALPMRVTDGVVAALKGRMMVCVVTHFNHPREITAEAAAACRRLREGGFMLLNQTVLLRGVNDRVETLRELFQELVYTLGAKPYYLHHCDLTRGLRHFRTTVDAGLGIMRRLRGHLSGVCVPTYMLDLPGGDGKIPLGPSYVRARQGRSWSFETYDGEVRAYDEVIDGDS
jgi:lysine 2,3-aminomutase